MEERKEDELHCYIHAMSPMKNAKSSNRKYFDCTLQNKDTAVPAVCFSPEKFSELNTLQKTMTPVKITNYNTSTASSGKEDIIILLLFFCKITEFFWKEVLSWLAILNNEIVDFSLIDVLFGKFDIDEDFIVINHILLLAKFYIYRSKLDNTKPSLEVFKAKLKAIFNIEFLIAKRNGKLAQHYKKWDSFISVLV